MTSSETISSRPILLMVLVLTPASSHKSFFRIFLSIISLNSLLYDTAIFPRLLIFKVVFKPSKNSIAIIAQGALRVNKKCRLLTRRKSCASRAFVTRKPCLLRELPNPLEDQHQRCWLRNRAGCYVGGSDRKKARCGMR